MSKFDLCIVALLIILGVMVAIDFRNHQWVVRNSEKVEVSK